jgi:hypothetical protein
MLIRTATHDDVAGAVAVDQQAFGEGLTPAYFESWLDVFPEGFYVACEADRIVGYAMSIRVAGHDVVDKWSVDTGDGYGTTHHPQGEVLYGVSLAAAGGLGAGRLLLRTEVAMIGRVSGLTKGWMYGRLPSFREWYSKQDGEPELTPALAQKYVELGTDPLQRYYLEFGYRRVGPVLDYYPEDTESMGLALKFETVSPGKSSDSPGSGSS